jgi:hypothetical protein
MFDLYLIMTFALVILAVMALIINAFELEDAKHVDERWKHMPQPHLFSFDSNRVDNAKRSVRWSVYAIPLATIWPVTLLTLILYGLYKLTGPLRSAFSKN